MSSCIVRCVFCYVFTLSSFVTCHSFIIHIFWWHHRAVRRRLNVGFCGQSTSCMRPYYLATWLWPTLPNIETVELFSHSFKPVPCFFAQMETYHIRHLQLQSSADNESHCRHLPVDEVWLMVSLHSTRLTVTQPPGWTIWQWQHSWSESYIMFHVFYSLSYCELFPLVLLNR